MDTVKNDKRVTKTLKLIDASFFRLMYEKDINKITATDICGEANINRGTFYRYYKDIIDLREKIELKAAQILLDSILDNYNFSPEHLDFIETLFESIKKCPDEAYLLFGFDSDNWHFSNALKHVYNSLKESSIPEWLKRSDITLEQAEAIFFHTMIGGFALLKTWYNRSIKLSEEEFKDIYRNLTFHGLLHYVYTK